jgi:DNA-directed RNA polymerase subunit RPC12/RpoP
MIPHNKYIACPHCGGNIGWEFIRTDLAGPYHCYHCNKPFVLTSENAVTIQETGSVNLSIILPVLEEGEIVLLVNEEHPWHNEIALICGRKHKHYHLEILGKRLWVPEDWVRKIDESLADSDQ